MGQLTISHNFAGETGFVIAVPRLSTAPLADVICTIDGVTGQTRIPYAAPHAQESLLIEDLLNRWYVVKFYRSADGTSLDEEILTLAGNALTGAVYPVKRYEYIVGRGDDSSELDEMWADPVEDDKGIRDERLAGKFYWVEERGTGSLLTSEIVDRTDDGGGFDFADPDKQFWDGGVYIVVVVERAEGGADTGGSSTSGSDYNDVVSIDTDTDYDPATMNAKLLLANWSATVGTLVIPNLSLIADSKFRLQTHGGTQRNVVIQLDIGDTLRFMGQGVNAIILGKAEEIEILFKSNVAYVSFYDGDYRRVGRRVFCDVEELNSILLDGTRVPATDYPRLDWWLDQIPGNRIVSELTWATVVVIDGVNKTPWKGFFTREGGQIRVPDERNMSVRTLKTFDSTDGSDTERHKNLPGGYQKDALGPHVHPITASNATGFGGFGKVPGVNPSGTESGGDTEENTGAGIETRPDNIGQLKVLII